MTANKTNENEVVNFCIWYDTRNWDGKGDGLHLIRHDQITRLQAFYLMWRAINFLNIGRSLDYIVDGVNVNDCFDICDTPALREMFR